LPPSKGSEVAPKNRTGLPNFVGARRVEKYKTSTRHTFIDARQTFVVAGKYLCAQARKLYMFFPRGSLHRVQTFERGIFIDTSRE
jgi:hypothetical protein